MAAGPVSTNAIEHVEDGQRPLGESDDEDNQPITKLNPSPAGLFSPKVPMPT